MNISFSKQNKQRQEQVGTTIFANDKTSAFSFKTPPLLITSALFKVKSSKGNNCVATIYRRKSDFYREPPPFNTMKSNLPHSFYLCNMH